MRRFESRLEKLAGRADRLKVERIRELDPTGKVGGISQAVLNWRTQFLYEGWGLAAVLLLLVLIPTVFRWTGLMDLIWKTLGNAAPERALQVQTVDLMAAARDGLSKITDPVGVVCWAVTIWILYGILWRKNYRLIWHPEMYFGLFTGYFVATAYVGVIETVERWFGSLSLLGRPSILSLPAEAVETYGAFLGRVAGDVAAELSRVSGLNIAIPQRVLEFLPAQVFTVPAKVIAMYIILYFLSNWLSVLSMQFALKAEVLTSSDGSSIDDLGVAAGENLGLSSDRAIPRRVKIYMCSGSANFQTSRSCVFLDGSANTGVLLHEMGHVAHKDAFAMSFMAPLAYAVPILIWLVSLPVSLIPGLGGLAVTVLTLVHYMANVVFRLYMLATTPIQRQYESAADLYAVRHGYGGELAGFLSYVDDDDEGFMGFLRTLMDPHPKPSTRVRRILRWVRFFGGNAWEDDEDEAKRHRKEERRRLRRQRSEAKKASKKVHKKRT